MSFDEFGLDNDDEDGSVAAVAVDTAEDRDGDSAFPTNTVVGTFSKLIGAGDLGTNGKNDDLFLD